MSPRRSTPAFALWGLAVAFAACSFPDVTVLPGGGGTGGGGSPPGGCTADADCPAPRDPCEVATCVDRECGFAPRQERESCGPDDLVCIEGACVACAGDGDCAPDRCVNGQCVPVSCTNKQPDPGETDEDCGGAACPPCALGDGCMEGADCASGLCVDALCAGCAIDADCAPVGLGTYCDDGACVPKLALGVSCVADNDCQSGHCPSDDNVCCDEACDGECMGCEKAKTGADTGTCAPIIDDTDPDDECFLGLGTCGQLGCF